MGKIIDSIVNGELPIICTPGFLEELKGLHCQKENQNIVIKNLTVHNYDLSRENEELKKKIEEYENKKEINTIFTIEYVNKIKSANWDVHILNEKLKDDIRRLQVQNNNLIKRFRLFGVF